MLLSRVSSRKVTLVEALEHGRNDLVDLVDDLLAGCHCELTEVIMGLV